MKDIVELKQKRAKLIADARAILDKAEQENRSLTAEELEQYNKIDADIDALTKEIEIEERQQARERELNQLDDRAHKPTPGDVRDVRPRATQEYRDAYLHYLRQGRNALDAPEIRALNVGIDAEGGYLVPDEFEKTLIQALEDQNIMRGLCRVISTGSGDRLIPVVASHGTATWTAEGGAVAESEDQFSQVTLGAHKVVTIMKVSEELLNDSAFDLEAYISAEYARRIGAAEEEAFIAGDGSGKPTGVIGSAQVGVTTAAGNAITFDELIDLYHSLKRPYRARATWLMADSTAKVIRKLKDTEGQYLWQPSVTAGQPDTLLGRPVAISDYVPAIAARAKVIAFGDFSYYWIADRQGRVFQRLNELYAVNGQVGFRAYQRVDGKLTLAEAVKVLQMAAA